MFTLKNPRTHTPSEQPNDGNSPFVLTVEGSDTKFEGKFEIAESIQIECAVRGKLKVGRNLVIGERGSVHADVRTVDAIIHGEYEGNMVATGSVEITPTGRVHGNIKTDSLTISKGGFFLGNVAMLKECKAERGKSPAFLVKGMAKPLSLDGNGGDPSGQAKRGRAKRGRDPESASPVDGTPKRRGRARAPRAGVRTQGNTRRDRGNDKGNGAAGGLDQPAPVANEDPLGIR